MLNFIFKYFVYYPVTLIRSEYFYFYFKWLNKTQYLSTEKLDEIQHRKLRKLLTYSIKNVPHYNYLKNIEFKSDSFENNFSDIPFVTKETLRHESERLISKTVKADKCATKTSGGSTGAPVTILKHHKGIGEELAAAWRGCKWAGVDIGEKQARFWGVPLNASGKKRTDLIDFICHRKRISAFSFDHESLNNAVLMLEKFKPEYFYGYVSVIRQFTDFYISKNTPPLIIKPKCIITTSETLDNENRELFSRVYGCRVFNEYGCGEVGTIAHECEEGSLHINSENILLEIVDENGCCLPNGSDGEIVVTDLTNFAMPLIRYKLKDFGQISTSACKCGRGLPVLEKVYGRAYDIIVNSEGKKFHGEFFLYIFEDIKKELGIIVDGLQITQVETNKLEIKMVTSNDNLNKISSMIVNVLHEKFDSNVIVVFKLVDQIERESSGKLRVIKGLV